MKMLAIIFTGGLIVTSLTAQADGDKCIWAIIKNATAFVGTENSHIALKNNIYIHTVDQRGVSKTPSDMDMNIIPEGSLKFHICSTESDNHEIDSFIHFIIADPAHPDAQTMCKFYWHNGDSNHTPKKILDCKSVPGLIIKTESDEAKHTFTISATLSNATN